MSWSFRALVLSVAALWGLAPQIACFLPDQPLTQHEMDCCEKMAGDCGQMDMSCCQTVVRTDILGVTAKAMPNITPHVGTLSWPPAIVPTLISMDVFGDRSSQHEHAPPRDVGDSSLILRI
jgi:hypothetical protein